MLLQMVALLLPRPAWAHPRPRFTPAKRDVDHKEFRCPAGAYLEHASLPDRTPKLQRHVRQALHASLMPSQLDAPVRGAHNASLFYTHESAAWPKPARCQARRKHVCSFSPHFCLLLAQGNSPRTSLVSDRHGIEFRQVWKVASSSLASFFYCNMWGDLRSEKLLPTQPPQPAQRAAKTRVVFPAREPISRFIAASIEVLERLINHVSPGGQRMPDEMYAEPNGPFSSTTLKHSTSWYGPLTRLMNASTARERAVHTHALVVGFVEDIECGIVYSAAEHLATQMSFLTSGYADRATLDYQIRLSNVTTDLEGLGRHIKYQRTAVTPATRNNSVWKCPLGRENDAAGKAKLVVGKEHFVATLRENPSLTQRLCTVYIQDYLCLGFPLPAECEGGRELEWTRSAPEAAAGGRARAREAGAEELISGAGGKQLGGGGKHFGGGGKQLGSGGKQLGGGGKQLGGGGKQLGSGGKQLGGGGEQLGGGGKQSGGSGKQTGERRRWATTGKKEGKKDGSGAGRAAQEMSSTGL